MIHEAVGRIETLNVAQRGLARWSNLKLLAIGPGEPHGAQATPPIVGVVPVIFQSAILSVILHKHKAGDAALHRVAEIVDMKFITIVPAMHIADGAKPVGEEGSLQVIASLLFSDDAKAVHHSQ